MCTHQSHWRFGSWAAFWLLIDHHFCIRRTAHEVQTTTLLLLCCICCVLSRKTFSFFAAAAAVVAQWQTSSSVDSFFFFFSLHFTSPSFFRRLSGIYGKVVQRKENSQFRCETRSDSSESTTMHLSLDSTAEQPVVIERESRDSEKTDAKRKSRQISMILHKTANYLTLRSPMSFNWYRSHESHCWLCELMTWREGMLRLTEIWRNFCALTFFSSKDYLNLFCWNSIKTLQQAIFKMCTAVKNGALKID